jgi:hypothetical protein
MPITARSQPIGSASSPRRTPYRRSGESGSMSSKLGRTHSSARHRPRSLCRRSSHFGIMPPQRAHLPSSLAAAVIRHAVGLLGVTPQARRHNVGPFRLAAATPRDQVIIGEFVRWERLAAIATPEPGRPTNAELLRAGLEFLPNDVRRISGAIFIGTLSCRPSGELDRIFALSGDRRCCPR